MGNLSNLLFNNLTLLIPKPVSNEPILKKKIASIEERCDSISLFGKSKLAFFSYIILKTPDNELIRIDYFDESTEPSIKFNYKETRETDFFRFSEVTKEMTVEEGIMIVKKHCVKKEFNWLEHNSQHVARDSFSEISGTHTNLTRHDYLRWSRQVADRSVKGSIEEKNVLAEALRKYFKVGGVGLREIPEEILKMSKKQRDEDENNKGGIRDYSKN